MFRSFRPLLELLAAAPQRIIGRGRQQAESWFCRTCFGLFPVSASFLRGSGAHRLVDQPRAWIERDTRLVHPNGQATRAARHVVGGVDREFERDAFSLIVQDRKVTVELLAIVGRNQACQVMAVDLAPRLSGLDPV